jgi:shikimate 5-dehydrogenase/shikimate kinase
MTALPGWDNPRAWLLPPSMSAPRRLFSPDASLVLIGLRGSGKRSLGFIASTELKWRFVTEDQCFEEATGCTRAEYLLENGGQSFRKMNVEVIKNMLERYPKRCVLECGLGSLVTEVQVVLREFCTSHPVVHVVRSMKHIRRLLQLDNTQVRLMESADVTHRTCSNFEYYNLYDPNCERYGENEASDRHSSNYPFKLKAAKEDFCSFIRCIIGPVGAQSNVIIPFAFSACPVESRPYTYAVTIRLSEILNPEFEIEDLESSEDAVEYIVDRFSEDHVITISRHITSIRRKVGVPIIYAVDQIALATNHTLATSSSQERIRSGLLLHGLRLGVDFVVLDIADDDERVQQLIRLKGNTKIIGSYINTTPIAGSWLTHEQFEKVKKAERLGCDILRLVEVADSPSINDDLRGFRGRLRDLAGDYPPLITYNLGELGKESLVINSTLTPVRRRGALSVPGFDPSSLLTAKEVMQELFDRHILDPLHFYVFGAGLSQSLSPTMHNAAYRTCGLRYDYQIYETSLIDDIWTVAQDSHFGGASISRPFKVAICDHLTVKSSHVEAIGATNTLIPLRASPDSEAFSLAEELSHRGRAGRITGYYGDNTDWIGIKACILRNLSPRNVIHPSKTTGLVVGAGGMARAAIYALIQLGCSKILIYNRTRVKAEQVASHFNMWLLEHHRHGQDVEVLLSSQEHWPPGLPPATIVLSCIPAHGYESVGTPGIPLQWLSSPSGGLVLEVGRESNFSRSLQC